MASRTLTIVSSKGQVVLPKAVRDQRRWPPGTRLVVEDTDQGVLLKLARAFAATKAEDVFGCLPYEGAPKSLDEMKAAIDAEAKRRHVSGRY